MAAEILLTSEAFIKTVTSISDNLAGKYILPSLREAQEIGLRGILGDCLLDALKGMVADKNIPGPYSGMMTHIQYYLAYQTVVEVLYKSSFKVTNFGVAKSQDENLQVAATDEIGKLGYYYQAKADAACFRLQNYLLNNRAEIPELDGCDCDRIKANLYSAATCGIWLGGARGKQGRNAR